MLKQDITASIGSTPLTKINSLKTGANIYAKLEMFNPLSSVKDRAALYMITEAERAGALPAGGTIIEPTSGNTGIALAYIGKLRGYSVILTMPETMSVERRKLLELLGAELILTPGSQGMKGAIAKAADLVANTKGSFMPNQFENPANPQSHFETTAPEIWADSGGNLDFFVAGAGTGGTISGIGRFLKQKNAGIKIVAVEPAASPVISGGQPGPHKIQGIGAGFIPKNLDLSVIDSTLQISDDEAFETAKMLRTCEGIFCGISSGAAMAGAIKIAAEPENKGKNIVVLLPDTAERYLSML